MEAADFPGEVARLRLESERRLAIIATSVIFIPNAFFAVTDRAIVTNDIQLQQLYALRVAAFAMWGAGILLLRRCADRDALQRVIFGLAIGLALYLVAVQLARPAENWLSVRTNILVAFLIFAAYPNRNLYQVLPWGLLVAGTMAATWWHNPLMAAVDRVSVLSHLLIGGVLGMLIASNRRALERDMAESLDRERAAIADRERAAAELQTLEGIIPICSYCHHVRTEAGAWEGLDRYVRARTEAKFSHGICPNCVAEHFPGVLDQRTPL